MLPLSNPHKAREKTANGKFMLKLQVQWSEGCVSESHLNEMHMKNYPNSRAEMMVPTAPHKRIGRRPYLSDILPQKKLATPHAHIHTPTNKV